MKKTILLLYFVVCCMSFFNNFAQTTSWISGMGVGNSGSEESYDIAMDSFGNIYITGWFDSSTITFGSTTLTNSGTGSDIFIVKMDKNYNVIWARKAGEPAKSEVGRSITIDKNNDVVVTGLFSYSITFGSIVLNGSSLADVFTVKYDQNGNALWAKAIYGNTNEQGRSITTDSERNVYVTGSSWSPSLHFGTDTTLILSGNDDDYFIVKYNSSGNFMWARNAGGSNPSGSRNDVGLGITTDNKGHVYTAGQFESNKIGFDTDTLINHFDSKNDIFVVCYNSNNGSVVWAEGAGGNGEDYLTNIKADSIGNFVITGYYNGLNCTFGNNTLNKIGNTDGFAAKYNNAGNLVWVKDFGYTNSAISLADVFMDSPGNIYLNGNYGVKLILGSDTLSTRGGNDIFVLKYDSLGNKIWAIDAGGNSLDWTYSITGDVTDIFVTGTHVSNNLQFNTNILTCTGSQDLYIARAGTGIITGINKSLHSDEVVLRPNPSTGLFFLFNVLNIESVTILNVLGEVIYKSDTENTDLKIDLAEYSSGLYYIGLTNRITKEKTCKKIIIEK